MKYYIFHPMNVTFNHELISDAVMYEKVAVVEAANIEKAYKLAQNINEDYSRNGCRSTSVGDIIQSEVDVKTDHCHIVSGDDFISVPADPWLTYKDHEFLAKLKQELPEDDDEDIELEYSLIEQEF